jgi:hypothetical protein
MQIRPLGAERAKITTENDVQRLDAAKDDLGLKTPDAFSILCGECG